MHLCLGMRLQGEPALFDPDDLAYAAQFGVTGVKICGSDLISRARGNVLHAEDAERIVEQLDEFGIALSVVLLPQGRDTQYWNARLGRPEREQEAEDVCETIRIIGSFGVPVVEWTWSVPDVWGSTRATGRGGAGVRRFDYDAVRDVGPVEPDEAMVADVMWERLLWFTRRIVPAAEEAGVRLALHPHDPPTEWLRGEARIIGTVEGLQRLFEEVPSPANGMNFCQGTVAEMGVDVIEAIRLFGADDRINHVHFRDVKGAVPLFDECFVDDGDTDMLEAMRAYHDVGYRYAMMPDHTPAVAGDTPYGHRGRAFALGYMRALMDVVCAE
ncbi:MAG: TIM barrel protein [Armatimonadia bacterium]|nr:TIM barrel protein [Armatimonadia bacterium]